MKIIIVLVMGLVLFSFVGGKKYPPATESYIPKKSTLKKVDKVQAYVDKYLKIALAEQSLYGIPASITLAQGIVESNSGTSSLSVKCNNHFGMKWRRGRKEKYAIYHDDSPKDKFVVYKSAWYSFRDHSKLLMNERYNHLFKLKCNDYKGWARGLKKCGYATNKSYDKILISVIERYKLNRFDN
jgi:flagellum-specific peptidoglycan hydrolase FlgJ